MAWATDGAAHRLDGPPGRGDEIELEALAGFEQRIDGVIDLQCWFGRQPGAEGKNALRLMMLRILRHHQRGIAADVRTVVAGGPRHQNLRFRKQQRAVAIGLDLQRVNVGAQLRLDLGGADPRAHQQDGGQHGKSEHGQRHGQCCDLLPVEFDEPRHQIIDKWSLGASRRRHDKDGRATTGEPVAHQ